MNEWKMLSKSEPTIEKEYLCLAVAIHNNEICHYIVGNNTIIAWCETPELPKNIPLADVLSSYINTLK